MTYLPDLDETKVHCRPGQKVWFFDRHNVLRSGRVVDVDHHGWPDFKGGLVYYWVDGIGRGHSVAINHEFFLTKQMALADRSDLNSYILNSRRDPYQRMFPHYSKFNDQVVWSYRLRPKKYPIRGLWLSKAAEKTPLFKAIKQIEKQRC